MEDDSKYSALLRLLSAFALLLAAALKGHLLLQEYLGGSAPSLGLALFKPILILVEVCLACWILSAPLSTARARLVCMFFVALASVSLTQHVRGVRSCGCFGAYEVPPIYTALFSASIAFAFAIGASRKLLAQRSSAAHFLGATAIFVSTLLLLCTVVTRNSGAISQSIYSNRDTDDQQGDDRQHCADVIRMLYSINNSNPLGQPTDNSNISEFPFLELVDHEGLTVSEIKSDRINVGEVLNGGRPDGMYVVRSARGLHAVLSARSEGNNERWQVVVGDRNSYFAAPDRLFSPPGDIWRVEPAVSKKCVVGTSTITVEPTFINLGALSVGAEAQAQVTLRNATGDAIVEVIGIKPSCGCLRVAGDRNAIAGGQAVQINVSTKGIGTSVRQEVAVRLREPSSAIVSTVKIPVIGTALRTAEVYPTSLDFGVVPRDRSIRRRLRVSTPEQVQIDQVIVTPASLPLKTTILNAVEQDGVLSQCIDFETSDTWPCDENVHAKVEVVMSGISCVTVSISSIAHRPQFYSQSV